MNETAQPTLPRDHHRKRERPYGQAIDHQHSLTDLINDRSLPARTRVEASRVWLGLEQMKREIRAGPTRRLEAGRLPPPVPVKSSVATQAPSSQTSPAQFEEPEPAGSPKPDNPGKA